MQIRLEHIQELEKSAAKGAAISLEAAYLLELSEAIQWARRAWSFVRSDIVFSSQEHSDLMKTAPAIIREQ